MNSIVSQHVLSRHPASGKPKLVQVAYSNGKIVQVHIHNNGQQTYTTIREGTTRMVPKQQPCYNHQSQFRPVVQIVYQRVIQRHSVTNAPKIVETKYSNGKIVRMHYHNDGRVTKMN